MYAIRSYYVEGAAPVHAIGPGRRGQGDDVEGLLHLSEGRGLGHGPLRGGGRALAAGHAVDVVVEHQGGDADVAARGVSYNFV